MISAYVWAPVALSFLSTFFFLPHWIRRAHKHHLTNIDEQKRGRPVVAGLGGLVVGLAAVMGILSYIAGQVFGAKIAASSELLAATATVLLALIVGLIDDLLGRKIGLQQRHKPVLSILIALPIMVVNAGVSTMFIPFLGNINLGLLYPLIVVPAGIVGAANGFNMLAGLNGLEAGMGVITMGTLGVIAFSVHETSAALVAACMVAALVAFLLFNWYPAKVLPGNTLTYMVGAALAVVAITANIEKYALMLFIPYFIELVLKARGLMQKESLAKPLPDGSLKNKYGSIYSLNHVAIALLRKVNGKAYEWQAAALLLAMEAIVAAGTLAVFFLR